MPGILRSPMSTDEPQSLPFEQEPLPHEDLALILAAIGGDGASIEALTQRVRIVPRVLSGLNRRWGRPLTEQDLEDLSQDVVLFVLQKLEGYQGHSPFDAWLYRFCSLQLRNRMRREVYRRGVVSPLESEPSAQMDSSDRLDGEALWVLVERLEPTDRDIIHAKHKSGLSFTEIGREFDLAVSSVKTRYYRTIEQLRQWVRQDPGQGERS